MITAHAEMFKNDVVAMSGVDQLVNKPFKLQNCGTPSKKPPRGVTQAAGPNSRLPRCCASANNVRSMASIRRQYRFI